MHYPFDAYFIVITYLVLRGKCLWPRRIAMANIQGAGNRALQSLRALNAVAAGAAAAQFNK